MQTLPPILYQDDMLIAFNKPSGLLVAPDRWDKDRPNLIQSVHAVLSADYFNVHRIDADTSGILLCAKTKPALDQLSRQFEERDVKKEYLALTRGVPADERGTIRKNIAPDRRIPGRMQISPYGKPAETQFEIVERWRGFALVKCVPLTGRTHQIRLHLASIGCPILGDPFYGDGVGLMLSEIKRKYKQKDTPERPLIGRLALHAAVLSFAHPGTGRDVRIEAPWPKDFEIAIKYLRRFV